MKRENWQPTQHSWICSAHFINGKSDDPLSPDYVPSIFDYVRSPLKRKRASALEDYHRRKRSTATRVEATMRMEAASSLLVLQTGSGTSSSTSRVDAHAGKSTQTEPVTTTSVGTQTETTMSFISNLEEGHARLTKEKIASQMTEQSLQGDDSRVKFYTGLTSFVMLKALFDHIRPSAKEHHRSSLTYFQQFLLVLMKLRLNLLDQDLAYRFAVSQSTVSKVIKKWMEIMYIRLKPLVKWPEREMLK